MEYGLERYCEKSELFNQCMKPLNSAETHDFWRLQCPMFIPYYQKNIRSMINVKLKKLSTSLVALFLTLYD